MLLHSFFVKYFKSVLFKVLLEAGADPVLQDIDGRDAFDFCEFDAEYVKELMRRKCGKLIIVSMPYKFQLKCRAVIGTSTVVFNRTR